MPPPDNQVVTELEWQTDALAAPAANKAVEGASFTDGTVSPTVRTGNYTQIVTKVFKVAKTQEEIDKAGRKSEIAYQTEKYSKELALDLEYANLLNTSAVAGNSTTAREMKGVDGFVTTNVTVMDGGAGAPAALTEAKLNDNLQLIWAAGGKPSTAVVGAFQKRKISGFTTNTRYMVADENKLSNAVDIYQSDFGTITIRLHTIVNAQAPSKVFIFGDMGLWKQAWLRPIKREKQPFAGDADLFAIFGETTLESRQEKGMGKITNLTTA